MILFPCPYLQGEVELTEERERHIAKRHLDLLPDYCPCVATTLFDSSSIYVRVFAMRGSLLAASHCRLIAPQGIACFCSGVWRNKDARKMRDIFSFLPKGD